jgi:hypothetical protein
VLQNFAKVSIYSRNHTGAQLLDDILLALFPDIFDFFLNFWASASFISGLGAIRLLCPLLSASIPPGVPNRSRYRCYGEHKKLCTCSRENCTVLMLYIRTRFRTKVGNAFRLWQPSRHHGQRYLSYFYTMIARNALQTAIYISLAVYVTYTDFSAQFASFFSNSIGGFSLACCGKKSDGQLQPAAGAAVGQLAADRGAVCGFHHQRDRTQEHLLLAQAGY